MISILHIQIGRHVVKSTLFWNEIMYHVALRMYQPQTVEHSTAREDQSSWMKL